MSHDSSPQEGQCQCGNTKFTIQGKPIVRMFCHCEFCQEFNSAAYGDVTIFLSKDVQLHDKKQVSFQKYKAPPAVQRGKCVACNKPAIEFLDIPLLSSLTIIPSANIGAGEYLPQSWGHIFYHRRIDDIKDSLPKYSGFMKSQLAMCGQLIPGIFRKLVKA